ncbi:Putative Biotrophy-associated secreted protein 2 [[Torrubiella] hemipterigena]|uniref:Putative Biotrophy-associated secreted protein 2 n=1 Tax=[Torrubiella] hemipterigena TaxID=1531966 RepID=A0A0A1SPX9_9HYPO|nr:Putative Biotrophy-associated secreted protein 2 [[Torrubiella] hemipterigena]
MVRIAIATVIAFAVTAFAVGDPAGAANVGNGKGKQFITGACLSNADCASGCCAGLGDGAVCSGPAVGNAAGKRGCGFPDVGGPGAGAAPKKQKARPAGCPPCARGFE